MSAMSMNNYRTQNLFSSYFIYVAVGIKSNRLSSTKGGNR